MQEDGFGGMGDLGDLSRMMGEMDPKMIEELAGLGDQFDEVMQLMARMSPEDLQKQMQDAMQMLQSGDMMKNLLENQDEIIKALEEAGQIDAEELAKFKTDPEYFEQKMKESFDQMGDLFSDPDILKMATESMQGLSELYENPDMLTDMMKDMMQDFDDDEKIEEVRQMYLKNPELGHPALKEMFSGEEMQEILSDPKKWRDSVKEGQGLLNKGMAGGVGSGEL